MTTLRLHKRNLTRRQALFSNQKGIVLVAGLLFLMCLTLLGATAIMVSSTEMKIGSNYKSAKEAFYNAEAGVQYVIGSIDNALAAGTLTLSGASVSVSYAAPTGFTFDTVTTLTRVGSTSDYRFQVTGHGSNSSACTIEATVHRDTFLTYGIFGDQSLDMKNSGAAYSYDSRLIASPAVSDSTHEADVGSNQQVTAYNNSIIDGDAALGKNAAGTQGTYSPQGGGPTVTGTAPVYVDRVPPDPLGAVGGALATTFTTVSGSNDNAWGTIGGNTISLGNRDSKTLCGKSGGANYYLSSLTLNNGATLNIDASSGPVNIYLTGALEAKNGSAINITGLPTNFTIYSNSTSSIVFKHGGTFKGSIYAPYAPIEMKNSSEVYGMIWANTVDIKNSGQFFFDTALKDKFSSNSVEIVSWKEIRN